MFTTTQCAELWRRYRADESVHGIGRALSCFPSTVRRKLQYAGGIAPAAHTLYLDLETADVHSPMLARSGTGADRKKVQKL